MVNYLIASDVVATRLPVFECQSEEISSVDIRLFMKINEPDGRDWQPSDMKIDETMVKWLRANADENWTLDLQGYFIHFENTEDCWRFLEWLEEYEARDEILCDAE